MKKFNLFFVVFAILTLFSLLLISCGGGGGNSQSTNSQTIIPSLDPTPSSSEKVYVDNSNSYAKLLKNGSSTIEYGSDNMTCEVHDKDGNLYTSTTINSLYVINETKYNEYSLLGTNKAKQEWLETNALNLMDFNSITIGNKPGKYYTFINLGTPDNYYYTNPSLVTITKKDVIITGITDTSFYARYTFPTDGEEPVEKITLSTLTDNPTNYINIGSSVLFGDLNVNDGHFEFENPNEEIDCSNNGETRKIKFVLNEEDPNVEYKISDYYTSNKEYDIKLVIEKGKVETPHTKNYPLDNIIRNYSGKEYNILTDDSAMIDLGFDSKMFTTEGDVKGTNAGEYQLKFALKNNTNYEWYSAAYPEYSPQADTDNKLVFNWKIDKSYSNINDYVHSNTHIISPSGTWTPDDVYKNTYTDLVSPLDNYEYKIIPESNEIEFYIEYDENLVPAKQYRFTHESSGTNTFYGYPADSGFSYHFENEVVSASDGKISNKVIFDTIGNTNWYDIRFIVEAVPDENITEGSSPNGQLITVKKLISNRTDIINNIKENELDQYDMQIPTTIYSTYENSKNMAVFGSSKFLKDTSLGTTDGKYMIQVDYTINYETKHFQCYLDEKVELPDEFFDTFTWFYWAKIFYCKTVNNQVDKYTEIIGADTVSVDFVKRIPERDAILASIMDSSETNPIVINTFGYYLTINDFINPNSFTGHYCMIYNTDSSDDMSAQQGFEMTHGDNGTINYYDGQVHEALIRYIPYDNGVPTSLYESLEKTVYVVINQ